MTSRHYIWSAIDGRASGVQECRFLNAAWRPAEWLWVDSNGTDGKSTFHRCANQSWLSKICNHFADIAAWSRKSFATLSKNVRFRKKRPLAGRSVKSCVIYLTKKKQKFRLVLPLSLLNGSHPKSVRASSRHILWGPQISSKSVHFRRSYSRTRERHWNAPQSVSNTRRSFSFFAE